MGFYIQQRPSATTAPHTSPSWWPSVQALLCRGLELLAVEFLKLLNTVLVHGVDHVHNLQALLAQSLQKGRRRHGGDALARDVVDIVLAFLHAVNVFLQADLLVAGFGR